MARAGVTTIHSARQTKITPLNLYLLKSLIDRMAKPRSSFHNPLILVLHQTDYFLIKKNLTFVLGSIKTFVVWMQDIISFLGTRVVIDALRSN